VVQQVSAKKKRTLHKPVVKKIVMKRLNVCTCPAAVDITYIGHLHGCPQNGSSNDWLLIGRIAVARIAGNIWLRNAIGEALQTSEAKLGSVLQRYFNQEF
jgi:hypothetical protein